MHTLSTASYVSINNEMLILDKWDNAYFPGIKSIHKLIQFFYSENLINSSYKTMVWRDQVPHASFSSFLPEIQFSWGCEIRTTRKIDKQNCSKGYWGMVILFLLNSFVKQASSILLAIQFPFFYWCSAEKSGIGVQLFWEIKLHSKISAIAWY